MQNDMRQTHKDLFHTVTPQRLDAAFEQLSSDLPLLNDDEITVRIVQIAAMVRDGHSGIDITFRPGLTHVPLWIVRYDDGIFVRSAAAANDQAVGPVSSESAKSHGRRRSRASTQLLIAIRETTVSE